MKKYKFYFITVGGSTWYLNGNEYKVTTEPKEAHIYQTEDPDSLWQEIQDNFWPEWEKNREENIKDPRWGSGDVELHYDEVDEEKEQ